LTRSKGEAWRRGSKAERSDEREKKEIKSKGRKQ
jgi:hypothetical protein